MIDKNDDDHHNNNHSHRNDNNNNNNSHDKHNGRLDNLPVLSIFHSCRTGSGGLQVAYLTPKALATHVWDAFATRKHLLFQSSRPSEGPKLDAAGMLEGLVEILWTKSGWYPTNFW